MRGTVVATRSSGFDAEISEIGSGTLENSVTIRVYAAADRLSEGKRVSIAEWTESVATANKSPFPTFRANSVEILPERSPFLLFVREKLGECVDRLFPRKEA